MSQNVLDVSELGFSIFQIETKSLCNMNCSFCCYGIRKDKGLTLDEHTVYKLIDSLQNIEGLDYLCLSQFNEPLLDCRIFDFIKYAKKKNIKVQIITNGTLFSSGQIISNLINSEPWAIKVSFQTFNPVLFRSARNCSFSFSKYKSGVFEFLKRVTNSKTAVFVDVACNFRTPLKSLAAKLIGLECGDPSVYNSVAELKNDVTLFLKEFYSYISDGSLLNESKLESWFRLVNRNYSGDPGFKILENIFLKIKPFYYGRRLSEFFPFKNAPGCKNNIFSALASGSIVPCCMAYGEILSLGNIKSESLEEILYRNKELLMCIKNGKNLPLPCARCMGAPSKRAIPIKALKGAIKNKLSG